jgi:hypothetical protein
MTVRVTLFAFPVTVRVTVHLDNGCIEEHRL